MHGCVFDHFLEIVPLLRLSKCRQENDEAYLATIFKATVNYQQKIKLSTLDRYKISFSMKR